VTYRVVVLDGFKTDLAELPLEVQKAAALALVSVRDGERSGRLLDERASVGDLSDCYKLYFDPDPHAKPRYRLVYRIVGNRVAALTVHAVSVGRREGMDAYLRAVKNLDRD
jgi:hypothetical protein